MLALLLFAAFATSTFVPGKAFDHFFTIWLENQDFSKVSQNTDIEALTKQGILLTSYYGLTHPSQPNYIASVGGDYFGLDHDGFVRIPQNVSTLVDLFDGQDIEWKGYFEGVPGPGYMGAGSTGSSGGWDYVRKHNPFISYDSINLNGTRLAQLQSFSDFSNDLSANTLPQYAHFSPDMLNDGHNTSLSYAVNWTSSFLTPLLLNPTFMNKTLILLTYDESETYSEPNKIVSLLLGDAIPSNLKGTSDDTLYTHYSILSTLENNWNLPNLGRYDVGANVFQFMASNTGYKNHAPSNLANVDNSLSYAGFLNSNNVTKYNDIPVPNLQLIGAGGKAVEAGIQEDWAEGAAQLSPYDGSGDLVDGELNPPVYKAQAANAVTSAVGSGQASATAKNEGVGYGVESLGFRDTIYYNFRVEVSLFDGRLMVPWISRRASPDGVCRRSANMAPIPSHCTGEDQLRLIIVGLMTLCKSQLAIVSIALVLVFFVIIWTRSEPTTISALPLYIFINLVTVIVTAMKLNISFPANGSQKLIEIEDDRKLRVFVDKRMGAEVPGDSVGDEFKGYIFRITGGNDKQGFPMKQGVMHPTRVRLLLSEGHSCYRPRRTGERKRKSVRGCIVAMDLSVLALSIVKQGDNDIPGLTDVVHPKRLGPKRAMKIRKFFGLTKDDDVRKFVIRREVQPKGEGKKPYTKAPKIQRLITPQRLQHKRHRLALKRRNSEKTRDAANEYANLLSKRVTEAKAQKADLRKRRASSMHK
ncbi:hypothetical protein B7494_g3472 [Chlorociboria aeruginascens]|nr:hypothetical protein B7494_g3472 [Chlorociboria aeruginascens]